MKQTIFAYINDTQILSRESNLWLTITSWHTTHSATPPLCYNAIGGKMKQKQCSGPNCICYKKNELYYLSCIFYIYSDALFTVCFIFTVMHYSLYVLYLQWCIIHCRSSCPGHSPQRRLETVCAPHPTLNPGLNDSPWKHQRYIKSNIIHPKHQWYSKPNFGSRCYFLKYAGTLHY